MRNFGILTACIVMIATCIGCSGGAGAAPATTATNGQDIMNAKPKAGESQVLAMKHKLGATRPGLPGAH